MPTWHPITTKKGRKTMIQGIQEDSMHHREDRALYEKVAST